LERVFSAQHKAVEAAIKLAMTAEKMATGCGPVSENEGRLPKSLDICESAYPPSKLDLRIGSVAPQPKEAAGAEPAVIRIRLPAYCRAT